MGATSRVSLSGASIVRAAKELASCKIADETIILSLDSGIYFGLNAIGTRIWSLLQEPGPVSRIVAAILDEYEVQPDRCEQEVIALLQDLTAQRLIDVGEIPDV